MQPGEFEPWASASRTGAGVVSSSAGRRASGHHDRFDNLASMLSTEGDLDRARELGRALSLRLCVLGDEHHETLTSMNNLALTFEHLGNLPRAKELQVRCLDVLRHKLGESHVLTLTSRENLGMILWKLGDLGGAREIQEAVLEERSRQLGAETLASDCKKQPFVDTWKSGRPTWCADGSRRGASDKSSCAWRSASGHVEFDI